MMRQLQFFFFILSCLIISLSAEARVFVLGDSLSDPGALKKANTQQSFTYTDPNISHMNGTDYGGKVWSEYITSDSSTKYPAYTCNGYRNINTKHNLAVGGSFITSSSGDAAGCASSDLGSQVRALPSLFSNDSVIIWIGANDVFQAAYNGSSSLVDQSIQAYLEDLLVLSSKCHDCKIKIISVPHLGYTPEAQFVKKGFVNALNRLTDFFNSSIGDAISGGYINADIQFVNINVFYDQLIKGQYQNQNPSKNGGFVSNNATYTYYCHFDSLQASIDPNHICTASNPSQPYAIFADLVHPSSYLHKELYEIFKKVGVTQ